MSPVILIVDDNENFRSALAAILVDSGFNVLHAGDGIEALKVLDEHHKEISAVVVDLNLPGRNGFEVIGAISRRETLIGVLATSEVFKDPYLEIAKQLGAHLTIRKPENLADLNSWVPALRLILKVEGEMGRAAGSIEIE